MNKTQQKQTVHLNLDYDAWVVGVTLAKLDRRTFTNFVVNLILREQERQNLLQIQISKANEHPAKKR